MSDTLTTVAKLRRLTDVLPAFGHDGKALASSLDGECDLEQARGLHHPGWRTQGNCEKLPRALALYPGARRRRARPRRSAKATCRAEQLSVGSPTVPVAQAILSPVDLKVVRGNP